MRYNQLLCLLTDNIQTSVHTLRQALDIQHKYGGDLLCLSVLPAIRAPLSHNFSIPDTDKIQTSLRAQREQWVADKLQQLAPEVSFTQAVHFGYGYLEAIRVALQQQVDLVIKTARNPDWLDHIFDSDDMHLLRKCPVPVWLAKPAAPAELQRIVVAIDFDTDEGTHSNNPFNVELLQTAATIAIAENASLQLLNVFDAALADFASLWADNPDKLQREMLDDERITRQSLMMDLIHQLQQHMPEQQFSRLNYMINLVEGNPRKAIAETVKTQQADLLVMGTLGRSGVSGLIIGNTAESVLLQVDCAVLAMKPAGFVSPVSLTD